MRVIDVQLSTGTFVPIPLLIDSVDLDENLNKTALVEIVGRARCNSFPADVFYRGASLVLTAGSAPWVTTRNLVVEQPDSETKAGWTTYTLKCKCAGGRMQRTTEDKTWAMLPPTAIIMQIASSYLLVPNIKVTSPLAAVPQTFLQRKSDWEFIQELAGLMDADVDVVGMQLRVVDRSLRLQGGVARTYDLDSQPVAFKREGDPRGRIGARATNKRKVGVVSIEGLVSYIESQLVDPVPDVTVGGPVAEFTALDPEGVCMMPPMVGDAATQPSYLGKMGQFDAGAPTPSFETTPLAAQTKARRERRLVRDSVSKAVLTYEEWSPFGAPTPGAKIQIVGGELVQQGEYFVVGRRLTLRPGMHVELKLSRHGLRIPSPKKPETTIEALVGMILTELANGMAPAPPNGVAEPVQDFGGGGE